MKDPKGVWLSYAMLGIMVLEFLVILDLNPGNWRQFSIGKIAFFAYLLAAATVQTTGILLVRGGFYKPGGVLQIIASTAHILDLVGIIGMLGGLAAYRYPERAAKGQEAAA